MQFCTLPSALINCLRSVYNEDCGLWNADCGPGVKCRLSVKCTLQTESKTQAGCKMQNEDCRLGINYSHWGGGGGGFKGKKILQIHVNDRLLDIYLHNFISFFSVMLSLTTQKHNCNLEPFFPSERPHASSLDVKYSIHMTVNWYNTTMFMLK